MNVNFLWMLLPSTTLNVNKTRTKHESNWDMLRAMPLCFCLAENGGRRVRNDWVSIYTTLSKRLWSFYIGFSCHLSFIVPVLFFLLYFSGFFLSASWIPVCTFLWGYCTFLFYRVFMRLCFAFETSKHNFQQLFCTFSGYFCFLFWSLPAHSPYSWV